ncbi:MAG: cytochrome C biogenesis protein [Desulfobulbaceae bacterium]|nr:MAG: cytochrome C biogenesis protein [Desulfobulbaceae bacterium]
MKILLSLFAAVLLVTGCGQSGSPAKIEVGGAAPAFAGVDLDGQSFALADFVGKPVIIRFWSTECKYCRADTPVFNKLYADFHEQGLQIAYINTLSSRAQVEDFVEELAIGFPVLMDKDGAIAQSYQIKLVPQTIVIDKRHTIVAAILGGVSEQEIVDLLREDLLK